MYSTKFYATRFVLRKSDFHFIVTVPELSHLMHPRGVVGCSTLGIDVCGSYVAFKNKSPAKVNIINLDELANKLDLRFAH